MTAVVGAQVQFAIDNVTVVRPLVTDNRLRALAVTSRARQPDFPDLPTMIEAGVPDFEVTSFFGVVAPAGTPAEIVTRLNGLINAALRTPEMQAALAQLGTRAANETPQQFAASIAAELAKWSALSNSAGIKVD
jgi:tripartite-type tricarboxylate transporter receptor subunit TctC